jgi:indole-3-glycerol phosphate synthase
MVDIANTILGKIVDRKHEEFKARLKQKSLYDLEQLAQAATPTRGFAQSLQGNVLR